MNKNILFAILTLILTSKLNAQYNKPMGMIYDFDQKAYFVSNNGSGIILKIDSNFNRSEIIYNLTKPEDLVTVKYNNTYLLMVLEAQKIKIFRLDNNTLIDSIEVSGSSRLESIEKDKTNDSSFYISDYGNGKIYNLNLNTNTTPFKKTIINLSNINLVRPLFIDNQNRLLALQDTIFPKVYEVNKTNGNLKIIDTLLVHNPKSLTQDLESNFYISSWYNSFVFQLDSQFNNPKDMAVYSKPAGLCFDKKWDVLGLACSNCNKTDFIKLHWFGLDDYQTIPCPGDSFNIGFSTIYKNWGTYENNNIWTIEMSDKNGLFNNPINISNYQSQLVPSYLKAMIPINATKDSGYYFRITSSNPKFISYSIPIIVPKTPNIKVGNQNEFKICKNQTLELGHLQNSKSYLYTWEPSSNVSNPTSNFTLFKGLNNTNQILIAKDTQSGCISTDTAKIRVIEIIKPDFLKDNISSCKVNGFEIGGISNYKFTWKPGFYVSDSNFSNPKYIYNQSDTIYYQIKESENNCTLNGKMYIQYLETPKLNLSKYIRECEHVLIKIGQEAEPKTNYIWNNKNLLDNHLISNPSFLIPRKDTIYTFILNAIHQETACQASDTIYIEPKIFKKPIIKYINNNPFEVLNKSYFTDIEWYYNDTLISNDTVSRFFNKNGLKLKLKYGNCHFDTIVYQLILNINNEIENPTKISPNPFSNHVTIHLKDPIITIEIINQNGQSIIKTSDKFKIEQSLIDQKSGIYYLKTISHQGIYYFKVVKT